MNWNLSQLQAFVATVQQGSFSAAARHLGRAQSRVSSAVANMEIDIGFELFNRQNRYPILTERGASLYPQALNLLQQCLQLEGRIQTLASDQEAQLTLAMDEAFPEQTLDSALHQIEQQFPHFCLTLINGSQGDIVDYVINSQADFGLLVQNNPIDERLYAIQIGQLTYRIVAAKDHPLSLLAKLQIADLQQYRQYVSCNKKGEPYNRPISANCWYLDSYFYILPLVIRGGGWALLPQNIAEHPMFNSDLAHLQVLEFSASPASTISIIQRRDSASGAVSQWLIENLRQNL
ncbi:MAG: LysR family transcriptional regulator [Oceanospirillaceae bacterium]|nr:LysR family transcriptional regulator [Oceanospirillaceae bacterium]